MSMAQRVTLANENLKIAMSNPQMHNLREAYRRVYEALGTKHIDALLKPEPQPMPQDPATENAKALQMQLLKAFPDQDHQAHIAAHRAFMGSRMVQINPMVYALLQGHISDHIALQAHGEIGDMVQNNPDMQQQAQLDPDGFKIMFNSLVAKRIAEITTQLASEEQMGAKQDPLVALKQRELDLRAMDMQRKAQETMMQEERKVNEFEERLDLDKMKLENNEDQAAERIRIAEEKIDIQKEKQNAPTQKK
jgi:hypothetical protein